MISVGYNEGHLALKFIVNYPAIEWKTHTLYFFDSLMQIPVISHELPARYFGA